MNLTSTLMALCLVVSLAGTACDRKGGGSPESPEQGPDLMIDPLRGPAGSPRLREEKVPVRPLVDEIWQATSNAPFVVSFLVESDGAVAKCRLVSVGGSTDVRRFVPDALEKRFCAAIELRQYEPSDQPVEVTVLKFPPLLR